MTQQSEYHLKFLLEEKEGIDVLSPHYRFLCNRVEGFSGIWELAIQKLEMKFSDTSHILEGYIRTSCPLRRHSIFTLADLVRKKVIASLPCLMSLEDLDVIIEETLQEV